MGHHHAADSGQILALLTVYRTHGRIYLRQRAGMPDEPRAHGQHRQRIIQRGQFIALWQQRRILLYLVKQAGDGIHGQPAHLAQRPCAAASATPDAP